MIIKSNSVPNFLFEKPRQKFNKRNSFMFFSPNLSSQDNEYYINKSKNITLHRKNIMKRLYEFLF
jgi:hypothetical protein